ncbi:MAG: RNase adapter RapZ [Wenzhouxiangellaceae bacterium]|nr:RNase adapter RapZ [Wenzhouxiangellaceae bacterium]
MMGPETSEAMVVITGLSGSGKSIALNVLEDHGYYCVDNLPPVMLPTLAAEAASRPERYGRLAVGLDARAGADELGALPSLMHRLDIRARLLFLTADADVLIRRYSETRRLHPLAEGRTISQAIDEERRLLAPLAGAAEQVIDTSDTTIHDLRRQIWRLVEPGGDLGRIRLALESFAYKRGLPRDVDLVFDARCLPNPHWQPELRECTGLEQPVREFFAQIEDMEHYLAGVDAFVRRWLPAWAEEPRSHLTVAIGCTGGRHRSVWLVDELASRWRADGLTVTTHHRELGA